MAGGGAGRLTDKDLVELGLAGEAMKPSREALLRDLEALRDTVE
eukprot:COSAG05_NODE_3344_length_2138_cov_1.961275_2_plen_44_part_00